jgi:hypothetical protein
MALNPDLEAIKDAWDKNTGDGRDDGARDLAKVYVKAHPELFTGLEQFDVPTLVSLLSSKRDAGDEEGCWNVEAWLLACVPPQQIGGEYKAEIVLPNQW